MTYQNLGYWVGQSNDTSTGAHPTGWTNGQRWSETAGEWNTMYNSSQSALATANSNYSTLQGQYNTLQSQYNALLAGLNNPDGLTTTAMSWPSLSTGSADTAFTTFTLSLPRTGHFEVGYYANGSFNSVGFGVGVRFVVGGTAGVADTKSNGGYTNTGTPQFNGGFATHGDYSSGQTVTVTLRADYIPNGSASGLIYAHFVPNATYHN